MEKITTTIDYLNFNFIINDCIVVIIKKAVTMKSRFIVVITIACFRLIPDFINTVTIKRKIAIDLVVTIIIFIINFKSHC